MTLRTLNYGNYGILLTMGNAGFCPSTVSHVLTGQPQSISTSTPDRSAAEGTFTIIITIAIVAAATHILMC